MSYNRLSNINSSQFNDVDLTKYCRQVFTNESHNGINYSALGNNKYHISGTSTGESIKNIFASTSELPVWITKNSEYSVSFKCDNPSVEFRVLYYIGDTGKTLIKTKTSTTFIVPKEASGIIFRFYIPSGVTVDADAYVTIKPTLLKEVLTDTLTYPNLSKNGVTITWTNKVANITGTASSLVLDNLYVNENGLPFDIERGKSYFITANVTDPHIYLQVLVFTPRGEIAYYVNFGKSFQVPNDATGFTVRIRIVAGYTVDGKVSDIHIYETTKKSMPLKMVSFIDDDTTNDTYVTRYHDACIHNGVKGGYAVMTKNIESGSTSAEKLLGYEDEGFSMLIHCYYQNGTIDWSEGATRNADNCMANLAKGLRQMRQYGFVNYNNWITPGGNRDADMEKIARQLGCNSLVSTANRDWNHATDASRYYIKRIAFNPTDSASDKSMQAVKDHIDAFMADSENGWLIITTHFNEWGNLEWDSTNGYARFNEMVQYARTKGCDFKSFNEAMSFYETYCTD